MIEFSGIFSTVFLGCVFYCIIKFFKKHEKKNFKYEILSSVVIIMFFKWAFIDLTRVPTGSMENTLQPGDFVLISKLHYGARTPSTILQIPLTHQKTKFFEIKSFLNWIEIPFFRFPGFFKIKRNDVVVFNTPHEKEYSMDMRTLYVKRCIGLPGENIKMVNGNCFVNNKFIENAPNKIFKYTVESKEKLTNNWFRKKGINTYKIIGENVYLIDILVKNDIEKTLKNIEENEFITSVKLLSKDVSEHAIIEDFDGYIDLVNWGGEKGILIPKKGMSINLDTENILKYKKYILEECGKNAKIDNNNVFMNGKKIEKYTFKHDYYFMIGDNIYSSYDSRYWGFVRDDEIYAKPICTIFSKKQDHLLTGFKLRFFKGMW